MIHRHRFTENREGFVGYRRKGSIYLEPPAPPRFKPMAHPELLTGIRYVAKNNWLRWLVWRVMKPSARRRRILKRV